LVAQVAAAAAGWVLLPVGSAHTAPVSQVQVHAAAVLWDRLPVHWLRLVDWDYGLLLCYPCTAVTVITCPARLVSLLGYEFISRLVG
jgi:hypothetical protein